SLAAKSGPIRPTQRAVSASRDKPDRLAASNDSTLNLISLACFLATLPRRIAFREPSAATNWIRLPPMESDETEAIACPLLNRVPHYFAFGLLPAAMSMPSRSASASRVSILKPPLADMNLDRVDSATPSFLQTL